MIKKLRFKIIAINMILIGVVLLLVFVAMIYNSYKVSKQDLRDGLKITVDTIKGPVNMPPEIGGNDHDREIKKRPPNISSVCATIARDGKILQVIERNASINSETLEKLINIALSSDKYSDIISKQNIMYYKQNVPEGFRVAFADTTSIQTALRSSIIASSVLFAISIAMLFGISYLLSGYALHPIEKAWEQQKQFIADASHELKTPLTVIMANNRILMSDTSISNESRQWLDSTEYEADSMKNLIEDMLELAKAETDNLTFTKTQVNLSELIQEIILLMEPVAYERNILLAADIPTALYIQSNQRMLLQLIEILIDNAIKYAEKGSTVHVALKTGLHPEVYVQNIGEIISPEDLPHLFDRFYRTDKSRSEGGVGLGLAIAKGIADKLNIKITVTSDKENGTIFKIST